MTCAALPVETIYNGRSNVIQYMLLDNSEPVEDLSSISRIIFTIGDTDIDSDIVGQTIIWWSDQKTYIDPITSEEKLIDIVTARLGGQGLLAGDYPNSQLIVYDPDNSTGLVWSDAIYIKVVD